MGEGMKTFSFMFKKILLAVSAFVLLVSTSAQAQGELKGKTLVVYLDISTPPISYLSKDMRYPEGADVDIIRELQKRLGFSLKDDRIFPLSRTVAMDLVSENKADMIGGALSYTAERAARFKFSPIYYATGMSIMYSKKYSADADNLVHLEGKTIAVLKGSTAEQYVKSVLKSSTPVIVSDIISAYFMVANGKIDCVIYDRMPLVFFSHAMPNLNLEVSTDIFNQADSQYAFAFPKNSAYADIISLEIQRMLMDGTLYRIIKKWEDR